MYTSLAHFIATLESAGELLRIKSRFSPVLEITDIADRMVKHGGKALLFENTGTGFPLLINAFASDRRMCMALGVKNLNETGEEIEHLLRTLMTSKTGLLEKIRLLPLFSEVASWLPRQSGGRGACQEVVMPSPDLTKLPVLTCWPADGGPFITLPAVHTKDPGTGIRNLGMYRMQVFSPVLAGMHWHLHKGSSHHFMKYRERGIRMPVTVTLGGDPVYTYVATAPLPENVDEYLFAGFLRKKRVELVRCLTNDLEVPGDVDFVIEGYVDPTEELILEGPFGDHTGFYSLADYFPRFHVTCITHRRNAVYPATVVGIPPMEDSWIGKATERIFLTPMRMSVAPELDNIHMPAEGVFHNIVLASIHKNYPGQAVKVMTSLWGAGQMMFNKIMVIFDPGTDLTDYRELVRIIAQRVDPLLDIHYIRGPVDILDHSSRKYAYGSKMGIDATRKVEGEEEMVPKGTNARLSTDGLLKADPAIRGADTRLSDEGIPVIVLFVSKEHPGEVRSLAHKLWNSDLTGELRFVIFADEALIGHDLADVAWMIANHIDPMRDCFYPVDETGEKRPLLFMDGTRKSIALDGFDRDWPNVITMDDETIRQIDLRWDELQAGPLLPSPSLNYKSLIINKGAVVCQNDPD